MKNILLLLIGSLCVVAAAAQPVLTSATMNPVVGDVFYGRDQSDTAGISKGPSGPSVTWNLAGLNTTITDTTLYATCAITPFCDSFPGSALATFDGSEYYYFSEDASKFAVTGVGEVLPPVSGGCVYFSNPQNYFNYPTNYGDVKTDSFASYQPASQFYSAGLDSFIADAYGTLILPSGTYTNVMRVHYISYETDIINLTGTGGGGTPDTNAYRTENYLWYQPGFHNPLLVMSYDTVGGSTYLSDAEYYTGGPSADTTSGVITVPNDAQLQAYPNPANDEIHIKFYARNGQSITVSATDMLGRIVEQSSEVNVIQGVNDVNFNVANLLSGMYFIKIQTADNNYLKKVQVTR